MVKSVDGGATWSQSGAGLPGFIRSLAIARSSPSILYAGSSSGVVFSSANGGNSWNATGLKTGSVDSLAIAPIAASTVYAGTSAGSDAFVTKINASGSALLYSTYLGGAASDGGGLGFGAIAVEGANAYVAGPAGSTNFPITPGALQTLFNGNVDAFVVKNH